MAQSEIGFPFLFHEVPYVRANVALAKAGAFGALRLSGWCRAVAGRRRARRSPLGLRHYNLSISTSDQMIAHKFRGKLDRTASSREMTAAVAAARAGGAATIGVNAEDGSRTDEGFLLEFALAAREAGADRVRYCDTIGGDTPSGSGSGSPSWPARSACRSRRTATTTWAWRWRTRVSGALGDLDAGQDAWVNTCVNGIGERSGNADLLSCILAFRHGFGVAARRRPATRWICPGPAGSALWASYAFGQPLPHNQPGIGANAFAHESGIHADGALKDRPTTSSMTTTRSARSRPTGTPGTGRVVLTGEYGGKAGFRHVMDGLGIEVGPTRTWCSSSSSSARRRPASRSPTTNSG